jgi:signal transduction histidine kinase
MRKNKLDSNITLAEHLERTLRPFHYLIPAGVAFMVSIGTAVIAFVVVSQANSQIIKAVEANIASYVESQDRSDLIRLIKSISDQRKSNLFVIERNIVSVSSRSLSEIDKPYQPLPSLRFGFGITLTSQGLLTEIPIERAHGTNDLDAKVVILSPFHPILISTGAIALFVFLLGMQIGKWFTASMAKKMSVALLPVEELDQAIRALSNDKYAGNIQLSGIRELDSIRTAILETRQALLETQEALTNSRARELTAHAYRRLIHDLHNPVAALRNMIKLTDVKQYDKESREIALQRMPQIAEQILMQVTSARTNLEFELNDLKERDIRPLIQEATFEAQYASEAFDRISFRKVIPAYPVIVRHDQQMIRRAISNLVGNAFAACKNEVTVTLEKHNAGIQIQVIDDGPGLSQSDAGLFLQGRKKSTKSDRQALGLATANHIVRSHGGKIVYRTSAQGGACFEIYI